MTEYEIDPKLFQEVAAYLEDCADHQNQTESKLTVLLCASIVRGFLRLSKARQVELNLLGLGLPVSLASELADDIRQVETQRELAKQPISVN